MVDPIDPVAAPAPAAADPDLHGHGPATTRYEGNHVVLTCDCGWTSEVYSATAVERGVLAGGEVAARVELDAHIEAVR